MPRIEGKERMVCAKYMEILGAETIDDQSVIKAVRNFASELLEGYLDGSIVMDTREDRLPPFVPLDNFIDAAKFSRLHLYTQGVIEFETEVANSTERFKYLPFFDWTHEAIVRYIVNPCDRQEHPPLGAEWDEARQKVLDFEKLLWQKDLMGPLKDNLRWWYQYFRSTQALVGAVFFKE